MMQIRIGFDFSCMTNGFQLRTFDMRRAELSRTNERYWSCRRWATFTAHWICNSTRLHKRSIKSAQLRRGLGNNHALHIQGQRQSLKCVLMTKQSTKMMIQLLITNHDQLKLFFYVTQPSPHRLGFFFRLFHETLERLQQVARNFN